MCYAVVSFDGGAAGDRLGTGNPFEFVLVVTNGVAAMRRFVVTCFFDVAVVSTAMEMCVSNLAGCRFWRPSTGLLSRLVLAVLGTYGADAAVLGATVCATAFLLRDGLALEAVGAKVVGA